MTTITYLGCLESPSRRSSGQKVEEAFDRLLEQLLEQGSYALHQLQQPSVRDSQELRLLLARGYLREEPDGQFALTPLALRQSEQRMLLELFRPGGPAGAGHHDLTTTGPGPEPGEDLRSHRPGDPLDHLDVSATLGQALRRGWPLDLREEDLQVRPGPGTGRCACVLLIDLSGSMARHGKFSAARRAALALRALIRERFPGDVLVTAGFASRASLLAGNTLLEVTPRQVGLYDLAEGSLRISRDAIEVPEHFTNIQAGLRFARQILRREAHAAKQILLITDGEPTAHLEGEELVLSYPPTEATFYHTLTEARRCANERIPLGIFGLISEFSPPGLEPFLHQLAQTGRGKSVCCPPRRLATNLVDRFLRTRSRQE